LLQRIAKYYTKSLDFGMYFKQNRTGSDGWISAPEISPEKFRAEIKWSSIQLQENKNQNKADNPVYFRWEFGNIHPKEMDILILFGHYALQATATAADFKKCQKNSPKGVVWNADPEKLDDWLSSLSVWIYTSSAVQKKNALHCTAFHTRGAYKAKKGGPQLHEDKMWGGDMIRIAKRLERCMQDCKKIE